MFPLKVMCSLEATFSVKCFASTSPSPSRSPYPYYMFGRHISLVINVPGHTYPGETHITITPVPVIKAIMCRIPVYRARVNINLVVAHN